MLPFHFLHVAWLTVTILSRGTATDYQIAFTWMPEIEALHLACAFDLRIPDRRRDEVQRLIACINEQLWVGHFDLWSATGVVMYRQALPLPDQMQAAQGQCEMMLGNAVDACAFGVSSSSRSSKSGAQGRRRSSTT